MYRGCIQRCPLILSQSINASNSVYVSNTGDDSTGQVGNLAKPYRTFQAALAAVANIAEITIFLYPGTYTIDNMNLTGTTRPVSVLTNIEDGTGFGHLNTRIVIIGSGINNTRVNVTSTIITDTVYMSLQDMYIASINMPLISAKNGSLNFSNCYIQTTYNTSSDPAINPNYIVYTTGSVLRVYSGSFILISTPGNPTNVVMTYSDYLATYLYTRFYHDAYSQTSTDILTSLTTMGGHGEIAAYYTETYLVEPGNDEYSTVSVIYLDGQANVVLQDNSILALTAGSPVPAGNLFKFFDPKSTLSPSNTITITNQAISGLSNFTTVDTSLPPGSYQNIAWDTNTISSGGFFVNKVGAINANGLSATTNTVSRPNYTPNDSDYLIFYTGTAPDNAIVLSSTTSTGNPINDGRIIVVFNGTDNQITVVGDVLGANLVPYRVSYLPLQSSESATFQYVASQNTWVQTASTKRSGGAL